MTSSMIGFSLGENPLVWKYAYPSISGSIDCTSDVSDIGEVPRTLGFDSRVLTICMAHDRGPPRFRGSPGVVEWYCCPGGLSIDLGLTLFPAGLICPDLIGSKTTTAHL